eukprot:1197986-Pyramimonas_sp.AAC.1
MKPNCQNDCLPNLHNNDAGGGHWNREGHDVNPNHGGGQTATCHCRRANFGGASAAILRLGMC